MSDSISHGAPRGINRVVFLLALSVFINYIDRSNLSIAAPLLKDELGLSASQLGTLLSVFFWTYGCMQIPAGWLVDRFEVKWVFAAGFFVWSAATAVTGILRGFTAWIVIRVILGIGESIAFPAYSKIFSSNYFGESRRGIGNAAIMAGLALGPAVGMLVGGTVVGRFGWRPFFLVLGLGSLVWLVPWLAWMPTGTTAPAPAKETKVGILDIFRERSAWGTCIGQLCVNYVLYFLVAWLPFYLVRARGLSMNQMARVGGLIFFLAAISAIAGGKLSDRWIAAGASATRVRKTSLGLGLIGLGASLAAAAVSPDKIFVWALAPAGIGMGLTGAHCWAVTQTLAGPRCSGQWTGVQNFLGNFGGAFAPKITGYILGRTNEFYWPFLIAAVVSWLGALSWVFAVGPIEPVQWDKRIHGSHFGPASPADIVPL
ncbi:MAG TPA: MFS transporter [Candidatus Acidoferrum sp.]|jgi:ACS family D-galactonate transporter-like MFS transporter|nr:MFS transporter [Candidatus Acidoferrum sp.]